MDKEGEHKLLHHVLDNAATAKLLDNPGLERDRVLAVPAAELMGEEAEEGEDGVEPAAWRVGAANIKRPRDHMLHIQRPFVGLEPVDLVMIFGSTVVAANVY